MDHNVLQYFLTQGPFAILFIWLLIYVMKNNKEREARLYSQIESQSEVLKAFSEKYDVIIDHLHDLKQKVGGKV